jgi:phosphoribosyl 1,2-cyclic phosphodiesterase
LKVRLWGTRGSLATAGPDTIRHGGNTSCVEVRAADDHLIVLDAGSGIRALGSTVGDEVRRIDVLLTHLHLDHVQGLGFFAPLFEKRAEIHIWGPPSIRVTLRDRLTRYLSPPLFPVPLRDFASHPVLHDAPTEHPVGLGGITVVAALIIHPGPTVGYRLGWEGRAVAYLPDHEPALGSRSFPESPPWLSGLRLADGARLLIHDAQYTDAEYAERIGWGHSTIAHAVAFASVAGVRRLVTFHHDPAHDDDRIDREMASIVPPEGLDVVVGREGLEFDL